MARKTLTVTISKRNRDKGKVFVLTEMSAWSGYDWASRVFFALMNAGVDIPDDIMQAGIAGVAALTGTDLAKFIFSMLSKVPHYTAKPILDDLMACVQIQPDPHDSRVVRPPELQGDIEEISTILTLQKEVFNLHFSFFGNGDQSTSDSVNPETVA